MNNNPWFFPVKAGLVVGLLWNGLLAGALNWAQADLKHPYPMQPYEASHYQGLDLGRDGKAMDLTPKEIYGDAPLVGIRVANGGAGYTGLIRALAEAYLAKHPTIDGQPFSIAWYATNTTFSYRALRDHQVDIAFIYEIWPEALHGNRAYGQQLTPIFNDAFIFVGPVRNPAGLEAETPDKQTDTVDDMLEKIITTGCQKPFAGGCSMYLSRSDLSGTYKKETTYFIAHRTPEDLIRNSPWYVPKSLTPKDALKEAGEKGFYTMNDKSTWVSQPALQAGLKIYADGALGHEPNLMNPCYGLLANNEYLQSDQPRRFLRWIAGPEGQKIMADYGKREFGQALVKPVR